jgi:hypothetical protein
MQTMARDAVKGVDPTLKVGSRKLWKDKIEA